MARQQTEHTEYHDRMTDDEIQNAMGETFPDRETDVPVGNLHNKATYGDMTVEVGDIVVSYDRPTYNGIYKRVNVGRVEAILEPSPNMSHEHRPELFVTGASARVPIVVTEDETRPGRIQDVQVSGEGSEVDPDSGLVEYVETFKDEYDEHMQVEIEKVQPEDGRKNPEKVPTYSGE